MQFVESWPLAAIDLSGLTSFLGNLIYGALVAIALWGAFCVVMVWMRVARQRFRSEEAQDQFLDELEGPLARGDFEAAAQLCDGDPRAVAQLALVAINHRDLGYAKVKHLVMDRFQRDVLSDLEQRLSWVNTVIKSAPMVGLFGTVIGMMGAFGKLAGAANVSPDVLRRTLVWRSLPRPVGSPLRSRWFWLWPPLTFGSEKWKISSPQVRGASWIHCAT